MWRPENWDKHSMDEIVKLPTDVYPILIPSSLEWDIQRMRLFEAGADAMLEAQKNSKSGSIQVNTTDNALTICMPFVTELKGWIVYIPEEESNADRI